MTKIHQRLIDSTKLQHIWNNTGGNYPNQGCGKGVWVTRNRNPLKNL